MWKAISTLLIEEPFFGHIITALGRIETNAIPTLGVTLVRGRVFLLYNPEFFNSLKKFEHKVGVIKHEILHVVLKHLTRDDLDDKKMANVAMDLVINQIVQRNNLPSDDKHYGTYVEDYQKEYGKELFPLGESTDFYYKQLKKLRDEGKLDPSQYDYDHHWKTSDDGESQSNRPYSDVDKTLLDAQARDLIERAKQRNPEGWNKLPGCLRGEFEKIMERNKPELPWKVILHRFIAKSMDTTINFTMKRFSKRFGVRPGLKKEKHLNLILALDSSGSVGDDQFSQFLGEVDAIVRQGKAKVTVVDVDTSMQKIYKYKPKMNLSRTGYGGTSFDPVFHWINDNKLTRHIDAVIYLTDGYANPPAVKVNIPVLFVITRDGAEVPGYKNLRLKSV